MAEKPFRPMLAEDATMEYYEELLKTGLMLWASYKLDGIRATVRGGRLLSRSMKPIPNAFTRAQLEFQELEGFDGELICGSPCGKGVFARCSSAFMSQAGEPEFQFHVFDDWTHPGTFYERSQQLFTRIAALPATLRNRIILIDQNTVHTVERLKEMEEIALSLGFEGLIVRTASAPYKQGRSTLKEAYMLKLKRFRDSEAEIIGFQELMHNANEQVRDERGFAKRSSEKAGQVPAGVLGALQVRDLAYGWVFNIGTGFDSALRARLWDDRAKVLGKTVKYKYLPIGTVDAPRHPVFLGFRDPIDMDSTA